MRSCATSTTVRNNLSLKCKPDSKLTQGTEASADGEANEEVQVDGKRKLMLGDGFIIQKCWESKGDMNNHPACGMYLVFHGVVAYCVERFCVF